MPKMNLLRDTVLSIGAAMLIAAPGLAQGADAATMKGMIVASDGATIVVRSGAGDTKVAVNSSTKIRGTSGALGIRGEDHPASDQMRGLAVEVTGVQDGDTLTATEVTFKNSDLKTAQQISAGIAGTEQRIDDVGQLVARSRTNVYFASSSATISEKGKKDLQALAAEAKTIKGFRLAVVGRADTTGNAQANQVLSERRAQAVTSYLLKSAGIMPGSILPIAAAGDSEIADDPNPPKTADEARRVTVTIAVSKSAAPS